MESDKKVQETKYQYVMRIAKRAKELNAYYHELDENLLENEGPKVKTYPNESTINIAIEEAQQNLI